MKKGFYTYTDAGKLSVTVAKAETECKTDFQEQEDIGVTVEEYQEPPIISQDMEEKLPGRQIKEKVDGSSDSQRTECMDIKLLEPPVTFRDIAEEVPVAQLKQAVEDCSDNQRKECKAAEEADEDGSSQETCCSESSFQEIYSTVNQNVHIVLASDSESHTLSEGTGNLGGISQATTVDVADLEALTCSEADIFASQSYQDTEVSGQSSDTVADYCDFVKGSHIGSQSLIKSSTALSMDQLQDRSSNLETSLVKLTRKRKHDKSDLSDPLNKLQRIAEEDKEGVHVGQVSYLKEGSSLCVGVLPSSPAASTSTDDVAKHKSTVPVVSPTKVTLKEKEVQISPTANRQHSIVLASPKASRKLIFETEVERQKPEFVLGRTSSKENIIKTESKTDKKEEVHSITAAPSMPSTNDSSPEIEILNSKTSRQSIEVVFVSSHSHDSAKISSHREIHSGRKRSSGDALEVVDIEDDACRGKGVDTEAECSDDELFLHLSPSPSQKSVDLVSRPNKHGSSHSASVSVDHLSYSSYKSSNAASLNSGSVSEKEMSNVKKQDKKLVSGGSSSERPSICTIQEAVIEEECEKTSHIQSSGSSVYSEHTNGSCSVTRKKIDMPFSFTKNDIVSPEGSPSVTDSFTTFSKVKDVAQILSVVPSQPVASGGSESELRISKRKRNNGKDDIPVVSIVGSDSESDCYSTPSEEQKKARTENGDVMNGLEDTPIILSQEPTTVLQKGIIGVYSTPQTDQAIIPVKESSASSIEQDSTHGSETEWEVILKVRVKHIKQHDKDVYRLQQCEDITEDLTHFTTRRLSDCSSFGGLGDVSSKNTSPSSTTSGPGPFALPPSRMSSFSTTSSSSVSSGSSSVIHRAMGYKHAMDRGPFVMPHNPCPKISRDRSFRSEDILSGIWPSTHSSLVEGMEILERVIVISHPESSERVQGGSTKADRSDNGRKVDVQKLSDISVSEDGLVVMERTDAGSTNLANSNAISVSANVLKETPRSTVKQLKGGRSRSSVKKRSISLSFPKEKEKETVNQENDVSELTWSVERKSKRGQQTPVQNKTPVTPSVQEAVTPTPMSEMKGSSDKVLRNLPGTLEASSAVLYGSHLRPGAPVFARWIDKNYYSGVLKEQNKDGRWMVVFDDGKDRLLVEDFIIVVDILSKGQLVYALAEDEDYMSGIIVNVRKKHTDVMYSVELDNGVFVTVSRSSLFMTEDQAKILRETVLTASPMMSTHRMADVSLDNVLEGKRSRFRGRDVKNKFDSPGVSGESKATPKKKAYSPSLTESDTSSAIEDVDGVERESLGREIKFRKVKGQGRMAPKKNWDILMGPIPPEGSKIFAGKFFLLTRSDVKQKYSSRTDSEVREQIMMMIHLPFHSVNHI
ncbi:uncharacterized protein LOC110834765 isoform X3 [Zootermopsis nevadensis]|uniref:uncharacterized protein LOC110834765 isoform X3 n=1 Tax=Zootermopsis nevadensis TaxID=136037 RepID=UPI000B8E7553|nr:uncharacterized protein LOC110834765 isoform X3 [Zootermopsis nevadensis]